MLKHFQKQVKEYIAMRPDAFTAFIEPAQQAIKHRRFITTFAVFFSVSLIWTLGSFFLIRHFFSHNLGTPITKLHLLALFLSMTGIIPGVWLALRVSKRKFSTLFGSAGVFWSNFAISSGIFILLASLLFFLAQIWLPTPVLYETFADWLSFLPLVIVVLFLQTGAEEMLFRGYLLQEFAARWRHPLIWIGIPSVIFGLLHYNPDSGNSAFFIIISATFFGWLATDLTRLTGNLGAAWGIHFANNLLGAAVIGLAGEITSGFALYHTGFTITDADFLFIAILFDFLLLCAIRVILPRFLRVGYKIRTT